jgi:Ni/Co efflux regulator RcnB
MRTATLLTTALAATMGFSTLASAQDTRQERREARQERREDARERVEDARERVEDRREVREDRRERREDFVERREDRAERREDYRDGQRRWVNPPAYNAPNYYRHGYNQGYAPRYYGNAAPRFYRGGYLPYSYRQPGYYVNWQAYPNRLYAPPYGYQWVHVGDEVLLIALATGLIATTIAW